MNCRNSIWAVLAATSIAAVASSNKIEIQQAVGPVPVVKSTEPGDGALQVYSAKEKALAHVTASDVFENDQIRYEAAHTDYAIYDNNGNLVKKVGNARNPHDSCPALVKLAAGQYKVVAKAQTADGWTVTYNVPVIIKAGGKTVVHLEPDWRPSNILEQNALFVQGHDGRIIGWLAAK